MPAIFSNPPFLALVDQTSTSAIIESAARIVPLLTEAQYVSKLPANSEYWIQLQDPSTVDEAIKVLDAGATKIVTRNVELIAEARLPSNRVLLLIDSTTSTFLADENGKLIDSISGILVEDLPASTSSASILESFREALSGKNSKDSKDLFFLPSPASATASQQQLLESSVQLTATSSKGLPCVRLEALQTSSLSTLFTASLKSDRNDGLFATLVASHVGQPFGLVYSSSASLAMSIDSGDATYFSRSRNSLWKKGETSGATQRVSRIRIDCDSDALHFEVEQKQGTGFCHVPRTVSCFGHTAGLPALEETLRSRQADAPEGSYTKRLFSDSKMLNAKIREEADELCRAETKEDIANEAADLFYFALVRCLANNVSLADVNAVLDKRAGKVTRRPGHAKAAFVQQESAASSSDKKAVPNGHSAERNGDAIANGQGSVQGRQQAMMNGIQATTKSQAPIVEIAKPQPNGASSSRIVPLRYSLAGVDRKGRDALLQRPLASSEDMIGRVKPIISAIRHDGDAALRGYIKNFDRCNLVDDSKWEHVVTAPFPPELMAIDDLTRRNIDRAFENIRAFHAAQMDKERTPMVVETMPGVVCTRFIRPIDRVGLYVPGGTAVLPSTALMLAVPAQIAGCPFISLASPPGPDGNIRPEIVYIAHRCGVSQIVKAGGAQAVASMAFGTATVGKVDKIFGPGNQWVTAAKMAVSMDSSAGVGIDMPAGPSEVLVIADKTAVPAFVAADLLSQAEHGPDSQVVLLAIDLSEQRIAEIEDEINAQALALPRVDIIRISISKSLIVQCSTLDEAMSFSNDYAPEHLILHLHSARDVLPQVRNAGSVFVGAFSPESCGDYASGTNHTLPTAGYARQYSGVSTLSFCKHITSQELSHAGLKDLGPVVEHLAEIEGLHGHKNAVTVRLQSMKA